MPVGPRHTPSLISGAELCPHPEINPAPMVNGHELTLIVEHFNNAQSSGYTFNIQGGFW